MRDLVGGIVALSLVAMPIFAEAQQAGTGGRTLELSITAQVITLLVLVAVFVAAVVITPRIWQRNEQRQGGRAPKDHPKH